MPPAFWEENTSIPFQDVSNLFRWRLHLSSPPEAVYELIATNAGRARFWAKTAVVEDGRILFRFPNGLEWRARLLDQEPSQPIHRVRSLIGSGHLRAICDK